MCNLYVDSMRSQCILNTQYMLHMSITVLKLTYFVIQKC
jgi:hypothetical protein